MIRHGSLKAVSYTHLLSVLHINHWEAREEINFTLFENLSDVWDEHKVGEITDKIIRSLTAGKEA